MAYTYIKLTAGDNKEATIVSSSKLTLEQLQKHVDGYIEVVCLPDDKLMVVNEEGTLNGLPRNIAASTIAKRPIVGDVLVCDIDAME